MPKTNSIEIGPTLFHIQQKKKLERVTLPVFAGGAYRVPAGTCWVAVGMLPALGSEGVVGGA